RNQSRVETCALPLENQRRVRHPLRGLRKYILPYLPLAGGALAPLFLAFWFWVSPATDYGVFKLFAFDWVQELRDLSTDMDNSFWVRVVILVALLAILAGLIVAKIVRRWLRDFSDPAIALVLERRFPRELGDRLMTAVEI